MNWRPITSIQRKATIRLLRMVLFIALFSLLNVTLNSKTAVADNRNLNNQASQAPKKVAKQVEPAPVVQEATPEPTPEPVAQPQPTPVAPEVTGSLVDWMAQAGISPADYGYVSYIVGKESGGSYTATNPSSGSYGLCQSLPAYKMASAGADWQTNPVTQLRWCDSYAVSRFGSWASAYSFWINNYYW